ncbi:MAG: hypothetical protein ACRYHQ_35670 [Janthinobacterium lividum]
MSTSTVPHDPAPSASSRLALGAAVPVVERAVKDGMMQGAA